jgi:prepilin-type N-terminal cleavage/methylation domain-containing protein
MQMRTLHRNRLQAGFTLVETVVALGILAVGVTAMAAMLGTCVSLMSDAKFDYIAQQKALEAVESIYTARDLQQTSWASIANVSVGGIFLDGPQPLCAPGPDGIVGTEDDDCSNPDYIASPDPAGFIDTTPTISANGDTKAVLGTFRRQIIIAPVVGRPGLNSIQVIITYTAGTLHRTYTLTTGISQYS